MSVNGNPEAALQAIAASAHDGLRIARGATALPALRPNPYPPRLVRPFEEVRAAAAGAAHGLADGRDPAAWRHSLAVLFRAADALGEVQKLLIRTSPLAAARDLAGAIATQWRLIQEGLAVVARAAAHWYGPWPARLVVTPPYHPLLDSDTGAGQPG